MLDNIIYKCLKITRYGKEIVYNTIARIKRENKRYYFRTIQRAPTGDPQKWYIQTRGLFENKRIIFSKDKYPIMPEIFFSHSIEGAFIDFITQENRFTSVKINSLDFLQAVKDYNTGVQTKRRPIKIKHKFKSKYYPIQREIIVKKYE